MKDYKGLVFFDYDGTLIDEVDGIVTPPDSTKEALLALQENGYATCIASGRSKLFCEDVKDYMNGYVTAVGAYVELDGTTIQSTEISTADIEWMREICAKKDIHILMDGEDISYCDGIGCDNYPEFQRVFGIKDEWVLPWDTKEKGKINKLSFIYHELEEFDYLQEHFSSQLEISRHIRYPYSDASPIGVNKGTGVKAMADYLHLPLDATYAFGDGENDLGMMQTAGTRILMGRHDAILNPYGSFTTDTVKENGIYNACKKLNLI